MKDLINKKKGIPVVLGGGASRGPGLLGLVDVLDEERVMRSGYVTVSIGTIVGTFLANGYTTRQVGEVFVEGLEKMWGVGGLLRALVPPVLDPLRLVGGGLLDLVPLMRDLVREYQLTTQDCQEIVCFDLLRQEVVRISGHDYPLHLAMAGSSAVPGLMRPVSMTWNGRKMLLVDGGVWHPHPGSLCEKPAIIGKLIDAYGMGLVYPDRPQDHVVSVGMPFARFFTSLSRGRVQELHQYGYSRAREALSVPLRRGLLPVVA